MATKKKMLQAAAGQAGGAALDITDVFSTYLYEGNGATQTITNGIDLDGEGGLVWVKSRGSTANHVLVDTERGVRRNLSSNTTDAEGSVSGDNVNAFYSNGFLAGPDGKVNAPSGDYASWTFRKAPKFFDVVTYTGDGTNGREIAHNLGGTVGSIFVKKTNTAREWAVYHRSEGATHYGSLNTTDAFFDQVTLWNDTEPTSTHFTVGYNNSVNTDGDTYVAYVFAHNDGDGGFGPDGDQDIIKCGSYSQSSASDVDVDLGFEPQFVIVKRSDDTSQWYILDEMRGFLAGSNSTSSRTLYASLANAEADFTIQKTATGFTWPSGQYGSGTQEYIYMAIRRGPLAQPESGTDVFAVDALQSPSTSPAFQSGFPVDLALVRNVGTTYDWYVKDRLRGTPNLKTNSTDAEVSWFSNADFDYMDGWYDSGTNTSFYSWMWKRAPGFFDVVAYSGNSVVGRTVSHNLTVAPEMIWVKNRDQSDKWVVYAGTDSGGTPKKMFLNLTNAWSDAGDFNNTEPTASSFTVASDHTVNNSGENYIAYLFATLPGVSKVGSFTGNGTSQDIDCGFTTAARFVLLKRTDSSGTWFILDTARGIVAGNDAILRPNTTTAEDNNYDIIDPLSSGFTINYVSAYNMNASGATYIFYAIA